MKSAKLSDGILVRYNDKGERQQLPVAFGEILKGKKEDFFVRANDVIFVPGSKFKNVQAGLLNTLESMIGILPYRMIP